MGLTLAVLLWFTCFIAIAGEWFSMWQSLDGNTVPAAYRFVSSALLILIFLSLPENFNHESPKA
ncbi:DUF2165 family protein [Flexibacterium corallicola]|uniref:DUF2165 family protein n=1 Tax=Flexibacterium corallicola TaxID=3037259 RepID=UPI00286F5E7A|nr:DUF2165 family protein [Pseudovibrio sp. M1P-2-3]